MKKIILRIWQTGLGKAVLIATVGGVAAATGSVIVGGGGRPCARTICVLPISPPVSWPTIGPTWPASWATPTPWQPTTVPTNAPRKCNEPCNSNHPCQTGLECKFVDGASHCRNATCINDPTCDCMPEVSPTPSPTSGPSPIPKRQCNQPCNANYPCEPPLKCEFIDGASHCRDPKCTDKSDCECNPAVPCNEVVNSGGEGVHTLDVQMGTKSGSFVFEFNTHWVKDRIQITYEGRIIFDTISIDNDDGDRDGFVGTDVWKSVTVNFGPGSSTRITVKVVGKPGTAWDYKVNCPGRQAVSRETREIDCKACDVNDDRQVSAVDIEIMERCAGAQCNEMDKEVARENLRQGCGQCVGFHLDGSLSQTDKIKQCWWLWGKDKNCPCLMDFQCEDDLKCTGSFVDGSRVCR